MSSQVRQYEYTSHQSFVVWACARWSSATDESDVSQDFTVPLRHFPQSCWAQWQSYEILKAHSLLDLCIMRPITMPIILISTEYPGNSPGWKVYLSSQETCDPVCERHCPVRKQNLVYDYEKCQQLMLAGVAEGYWYIRGGPFPPGLPQGALFTHILCNSLVRLFAEWHFCISHPNCGNGDYTSQYCLSLY